MRFLGVVEGKGLYASWNGEHNQIRYSLDGQDVAVYDMDTMRLEDPIVYKNNTIANELSANAKDTIQYMARNINIEELKDEEERYGDNSRDSIAKALGIEKEDMTSITEVDLDEEVEKDETALNKDEEKEKLATTKDIKIKQELKMDTMATSMKTIGQVLQRAGKMPKADGKRFTKLGIVESDRVKDIDKNAKKNTTRFSFVAIATDGTVVPVNLEQDRQEGNNPREISHRVNADGRVEQDDVKSRYRIGNSGETISVKFSNGPGNIEVGYSAHKTLGGNGVEGNVSVDHQLQTRSVYWKSRRDSRDQEYADGTYGTENREHEANVEAEHSKEMQRGQKGMVDGDNNHEYKNADGDMQTKDSEHENYLVERARKFMSENKEVANTFTEREVIERLEREHDEGKELEQIEDEISEDASRLPSRDI